MRIPISLIRMLTVCGHAAKQPKLGRILPSANAVILFEGSEELSRILGTKLHIE